MLKSDRHIPELDGLRGIAVVMVLVWHFVGLPSAGTGVDVLRQITIFGRTGVDLFFVLSGFLITGIIVDHRSSVNLLPAFYSRRALRILPPYVVLIAFFWLTFELAGPTKAANADIAPVWQQVLAQVTFSWNWLMAIYDGPVAAGFTVTWSVAIEEWFYLVFPIVVILSPPRKLLAVLILVAAMSATARAATHAMYPSAKLAPYVLTPLRLDGLCLGGVVALIYRDEPLLARLRRFKKLVALPAILLCLAIPFLIGTMSANGMLTQMYFWGHLYLSVAFSMLLLAVILTQSAPLLRSRFLKETARYSYSLYLFHPLFISLAFEMAGRDRRFERLADAAVALCALIFTVLFCYGLYALVERPLIDLGKRSISYATRFRMVSSGKHPPDRAPEPITT